MTDKNAENMKCIENVQYELAVDILSDKVTRTPSLRIISL